MKIGEEVNGTRNHYYGSTSAESFYFFGLGANACTLFFYLTKNKWNQIKKMSKTDGLGHLRLRYSLFNAILFFLTVESWSISPLLALST